LASAFYACWISAWQWNKPPFPLNSQMRRARHFGTGLGYGAGSASEIRSWPKSACGQYIRSYSYSIFSIHIIWSSGAASFWGGIKWKRGHPLFALLMGCIFDGCPHSYRWCGSKHGPATLARQSYQHRRDPNGWPWCSATLERDASSCLRCPAPCRRLRPGIGCRGRKDRNRGKRVEVNIAPPYRKPIPRPGLGQLATFCRLCSTIRRGGDESFRSFGSMSSGPQMGALLRRTGASIAFGAQNVKDLEPHDKTKSTGDVTIRWETSS